MAHLDLSFNSLETLPACVPQMCGLDALLLSRNCLSELPAALGTLPALTFLAVTHNRLRTLPPALGALSSLQRLDLSGNLLEALPPEIGGLGSLAELNLASNRLQSLPSSLGESRPWLPRPSGECLWAAGCPAPLCGCLSSAVPCTHGPARLSVSPPERPPPKQPLRAPRLPGWQGSPPAQASPSSLVQLQGGD